jgi:hypothetical protein
MRDLGCSGSLMPHTIVVRLGSVVPILFAATLSGVGAPSVNWHSTDVLPTGDEVQSGTDESASDPYEVPLTSGPGVVDRSNPAAATDEVYDSPSLSGKGNLGN